MRNSAVRCAHASNQEIAIFSGDFLPADGALPWRRQEVPGDSPPEGLIVLRTLTPSSAPQTPPLNLRFRGGKKSAATFATYYAKKGFTCYAFFHPICQPFGFGGKVSRWGLNCCQTHWRGKQAVSREAAYPRVFLKLTAFLFVSSKRNA